MAEENETNEDAYETKGGQSDGSSLGYLKGVCIAAVWVFLFLFAAALFWPNLSERTKFFTGNFFNALVAFAVIAQVLIYRKQWAVMQRQLDALNLIEQPCVFIQDVQFITPLKVGEIPPLRIVFNNGGRTPARCFVSSNRVIKHDGTFSQAIADYPITSTHISSQGATVVPNHPKRVEYPGEAISSQTELDLLAVKLGASKLYVAGEARYLDFQGNEQVLRFASFMIPMTRGLTT